MIVACAFHTAHPLGEPFCRSGPCPRSSNSRAWPAPTKCGFQIYSSDRENITVDELAAFKKLAKDYSAAGEAQIVILGNPFTCVTAYNRGATPRPAPDDIARILKHTNTLHYTGLPSKSVSNSYSQTVEKTIAGVTKSRKSLKSIPGHIHQLSKVCFL